MRITKRCTELASYARWTGDANPVKLNGYWTFGAEECGKIIYNITTQEFNEEDDYWPLTRDAFGRITPVGNKQTVRECGHVVNEFVETKQEQDAKRTRLWKKLLPFQQNAIIELENAGLSGYCCYDTGTGKTVIGSSILRENFEAMTPALVVCEAGDVHRWERELEKWLDPGYYAEPETKNMKEMFKRIPQVLTDKTKEARIGSVIVVSWTQLKKQEFQDWLFHFSFKSIIADEGHMFKDENSARTRAFIQACTHIKYKVFLSATWLENKILEAFVPLNILDPTSWPARKYLTRYCIKSASGKSYSLDPYMRDYFFEKIGHIVFRLTKEDAGLKFPKKYSMHAGNRQPIWISPSEYVSNREMIAKYNNVLDELEEAINAQRGRYVFNNIIGLMSHIRHITGQMKIAQCAEKAFDWLEDPANKGHKMCIGVHHKAVMTGLVQLLSAAGYKVLTMSDETAIVKDRIEEQWKNDPECQLLIASILGAGKGRNFQFCRYAICMERQWNKSKELQFEGRFHRTMFDADDNLRTEFTFADDVIIDYIMARDTFDEYFEELVMLKGEIVDSADLSVDSAADEEFILELVKRMVMKRIKYTGVYV